MTVMSDLAAGGVGWGGPIRATCSRVLDESTAVAGRIDSVSRKTTEAFMSTDLQMRM